MDSKVVPATESIDLRPAGNTGAYLVTHHVAGNLASVLLVNSHGVGPWSNNAHAA